ICPTGAQNEIPAACRTVRSVISESNLICPSTITLPVFPRPASIAKLHAFSKSLSFSTLLCPCPEEDIGGFKKQGKPTSAAPFLSSSSDDAKWYGEVGKFNSSAARRRMPSRSIVRRVARAVGITVQPSFSSSTSVCVAIASISGTMNVGFSFSTTSRIFSPSSIENTYARCAICIAGACSYRSHAMTSHPSRIASIATSFPSSPEPRRSIFIADDLRGVPNRIQCTISCSRKREKRYFCTGATEGIGGVGEGRAGRRDVVYQKYMGIADESAVGEGKCTRNIRKALRARQPRLRSRSSRAHERMRRVRRERAVAEFVRERFQYEIYLIPSALACYRFKKWHGHEQYLSLTE